MLKALREGAKTGLLKYFLLGMLVFAAGGLVLTDVGGFFSGGVSNNNVVAKGKNIEISTIQFDKTVRRVLARQGISPQDAYQMGYIKQILNGEIQVQILTQEARKLGINVDDETIMGHISKIAEPLAQDGMSKKDALKQVLRSQGVSEGEFIQAIRQEMGNSLFRNALVSESSSISEKQAQDLYQFQNELRDVKGFTLTNQYAKADQEPTEENLQKFYEANKSDFLISEKRDITIATLKKEMLEGKVEISDEELKKEYEDNIETYKRPERRKLQQAIVDIQTDAQDIVKRVNKGSSLKKSVKRVTGNTSPYLGENDFEQDGLLEEIATPVFEAESGAVIGPIQTALGWHVLVLKEIIEPQTDSFETAKAGIRDNMLQDRLLEDLVEAANTIDDQLASGEELENVVAEMGLTTEKFTSFNQAGITEAGKDLFQSYQGDRAQILEAAFDFEQGESSPIMELADGRFVTARVDAIQEKSYTPFETVKSNIKTRWMDEQKRLANKQRAEEAFEAFKNGSTLSEVAKTYGATVTSFNNLKRADTPKAPMNALTLSDIYNSKKDTPLKLEIKDGFLIAQVTSIDLPSTETASKEITDLMTATKQILPQETLAQYINTLGQRYKVKINDRVLKQIYGSTDKN